MHGFYYLGIFILKNLPLKNNRPLFESQRPNNEVFFKMQVPWWTMKDAAI